MIFLDFGMKQRCFIDSKIKEFSFVEKEVFLKSGIGFGAVLDRMSVLVEEVKVLREEMALLLLRATHDLERTEAVLEKYGIVKKGV